IYVVVESVYSMDGDQAPLQSISELCLRYQANLIVDEAHAVGIFGKQGKGLIDHFQLHGQIFARIVTFGKALGTHGAIVLGSNTLRNYLINFARSFIYTTAAPLSHIVAVQCAHRLMAIGKESEILLQKINLYQQLANDLMPSDSAIQTILYHNNSSAKQAAQKLQQQGFDVRAILSPTVPTGSERLRICLHSYNTDNEIIALVNHLKTS
ncbi:MAG: aminotransferase class I/II-fold pyridoxal phosphate-dependent enzyme, partial [Pedobacter sp.]|nr:aminotransferase class I/II-fold pyridoxal phosphate-dependent enzyme [Pedobacter sp.]